MMTEEELESSIPVITLQDSDGENRDFEIVDELEYEGSKFYALLPYYENLEELDSKDEDEDTEILIMRSTMEGDDEMLEVIEDEDLFDKVAAMFDARMDEEEQANDAE